MTDRLFRLAARDAEIAGRTRSFRSPYRALRPLRCLEFGAVRNSAPFGIRRRSEFGAVRDFAPFGISRR
jgi:hypothetical protein